jgi:cyclophilin family peptidyl-prolyl cis-trans isomerase
MASLRMYLEDTYGENLRSVYRHFALSFHDKAPITAEAAEAAGAQGKFWEMHDLLYERQQEWGQLPVDELETRLIEYAEELGLDVERFSQELEDHVYLDKVNADTQDATQAGLQGTPSYIVNGVVYPTQELGLHPVLIGAFVRLMLLAPDQYTEVPPQVIDPDNKYTATIRTSKGDIGVELFADQSPINVNSFVFLAEDGWYDGQAFFHVEPGFVAQSGDPTNVGWGLPFPGYYCSDEVTTDLNFDEAGMLALFTPSPGRNSSQFFITYAPQPDFNGRYTIIGRVVEGMDVAESLTPTQPGPDQPSPDVIETILIEEQ